MDETIKRTEQPLFHAATKQRHQTSTLLVCDDQNLLDQLRSTARGIGFCQISSTISHVQGLQRLQNRPFDIVFFEAKSKTMPCLDFINAAIELDSRSMMLAVSASPRVDDVFGLLKAGARGFIAVPFTVDSINNVLTRAINQAPISQSVLDAPDRNTALVGVILDNLYKISVLMRQAREFESASRDLELHRCNLENVVDMTRMFFEGTNEELLETIIDACIKRSEMAASRLGRTRKRLHQTRSSSSTIPC